MRAVRALAAGLLFVAAPAAAAHAQSAAAETVTAADSAAIRAAALNYVQGWYEGDSARMSSALHPELAKRIVVADPDGRGQLQSMTAGQLIGAAGRGGGRQTPAADRRQDVAILDVFRGTASVRADMAGWVDYMHLARWNGEWKIVNVLWQTRR